MKNIDNGTESLILKCGYKTTQLTGFKRAIRYCYPSSPMATKLGTWGYYLVATRTTSEGNVIDLHYPQCYKLFESAYDAMNEHFVLNYLDWDKYSQKHPSMCQVI